MNLVWMAIIGGIIGFATSMFVVGSRMSGLVQTTVIGALSYWGVGALTESMAIPVLARWMAVIVVSIVLLTGYILLANWYTARKTKVA